MGTDPAVSVVPLSTPLMMMMMIIIIIIIIIIIMGADISQVDMKLFKTKLFSLLIVVAYIQD